MATVEDKKNSGKDVTLLSTDRRGDQRGHYIFDAYTLLPYRQEGQDPHDDLTADIWLHELSGKDMGLDSVEGRALVSKQDADSGFSRCSKHR